MSNNLDVQMKTLKHVLEQWEKSLGLSEVIVDIPTLDNLLNIPRATLHVMSAMEIGECAFELGRFALHIQRKENQCTAFINWAISVRSTIFGDDKSRLHKLLRETSTKKDRIAYLSRRIEFMSTCLQNLQRAKYKEM